MNPLIAPVSCRVLMLAGVNATHAAQPYPERPIRMVVPWSPGGGSDVSGRIPRVQAQ